MSIEIVFLYIGHWTFSSVAHLHPSIAVWLRTYWLWVSFENHIFCICIHCTIIRAPYNSRCGFAPFKVFAFSVSQRYRDAFDAFYSGRLFEMQMCRMCLSVCTLYIAHVKMHQLFLTHANEKCYMNVTSSFVSIMWNAILLTNFDEK